MTPEADEIVRLIEARHANDVVVPECKDGCSQGGHRRMDVWVMRRSYSRPLIAVYEVKVTRSDFTGDTKWGEYLPYCNEFFWATPFGLVSPDEVPGGTGLVWAAKTGTRLFTKRKAAHRTVDPADLFDVFRYILMSRVRITRERWGNDASRLEEWKAWLREREDGKNVGHAVADIIRRLAGRHVAEIEFKNAELERRIKELEHVEKLCDRVGINPSKWLSERELVAGTRVAGADPGAMLRFRRAADQVVEAARRLETAYARLEIEDQPA